LALKHSKPCIFGVITTNTEQQAFDRAGGALGNKGSEAAEAAIWMLLAKNSL
jgi:6,7-dimethyl-8-ribityllumazine synthase